MNAIVNHNFNAPASNIFAEERAKSVGELSGGITGGYPVMRYKGKVWAIHHRQQDYPLMRDDGDGPRGSIDVVIVKANPLLSKTWYENGFEDGSNAPPDCASANGIAPDQGVPKKQNNTCADCPRNAWNTAPGGGRGKACGDHRRLAIVPLADLKNEAFGGPIMLRVPAASLSDAAAFDAQYEKMGYPYYSIGVKIGFDPKEAYPKFTFEALRPLTDVEAVQVLEWRKSSEVARVISETVAPITAAATVHTPAPQPHFSQVTQPAAAPVVTPAPAPAPQPAPAPVATGFGPVASAGATQAPPPAKPTQAAPQRVMTGFGATAPVTPPGNSEANLVQPVAQSAPPQSAPPQSAPPSEAKFDASLDERLTNLINN